MRTVEVPRGSGEPRGLRVFFAGLGRLRLARIVDFTGQPLHAGQLVDLVVREFGPVPARTRLMLDVRESDQRVMVEVVKGVGFLGAFLGPA